MNDQYNIFVIYYFNLATHEEAKLKLKAAESFSDIDSTGKDEIWKKNMRRVRAKRQLTSSSESDTVEKTEIMKKKKAAKTPKILPSIPQLPAIPKVVAIGDSTKMKIPPPKQRSTDAGLNMITKEKFTSSSDENDDYLLCEKQNAFCSNKHPSFSSTTKVQKSSFCKEKASLIKTDFSAIQNMSSKLNFENTGKQY